MKPIQLGKQLQVGYESAGTCVAQMAVMQSVQWEPSATESTNRKCGPIGTTWTSWAGTTLMKKYHGCTKFH